MVLGEDEDFHGRLRIAMHRGWREGGKADGDVFGPVAARRGVLHPFPGVGDDRLPGVDVDRALAGGHP